MTISAQMGSDTQTTSVTVTPRSATQGISFVQSAARTNDSLATNIAQAFPSANTAGNLIVVAVSWDSPVSNLRASDTQGNTYLLATNDFDWVHRQGLAILYAPNIRSGSNTVTVSFGEGHQYRRIAISEYSGVAPASPLDVTAKNMADGVTAANGITSNSATTSTDGELIFGAVMDDAGVTTIAAGAGFTQRASVNNKDLVIEDMIQKTAGTVASTQTFGAAHRYLAQMATFRPAASGTPMSSITPSAAPVRAGQLKSVSSAVTDENAASTAQAQPAPVSLACAEKSVRAGDDVICEIRLSSNQADAMKLAVVSSSEQVKVPAVVTTRPHQSTLTFQASTNPASAATTATIAVQFGGSSAQDSITVVPSPAPVLSTPSEQAARFGTPLRFTVSASDSSGLPVYLSASSLPAGAFFDAASGRFDWIPTQLQKGVFQVTFTATNGANASSSKSVQITVDAGQPVIDSPASAVCSPGAIGMLRGRWLSSEESTLADLSGNRTELGGTRVRVNGVYAPVLVAAASKVDFLCPSNMPTGTPLEIVVETAAGAGEPVRTAMQAASPAVLTLDGSGHGQGLVTISASGELAMNRNYHVMSQPAQPGDSILIWATGLGTGEARPEIELGGVRAEVVAVRQAAGYAGAVAIEAKVPEGVAFGSQVPLRLEMPGANGNRITGNTVDVTIEAVRP